MNSSSRSLLFVEHLLHNSPAPSPRILHQIQAQILTNPSPQSCHRLLYEFISSCFRSGDISKAFLLLRHLPKSSASLWNQLIRFSAECNPSPEFFAFYRAMLHQGIRPDKATIGLVLRFGVSLRESSNIPGAIHCQIMKLGFATDRFLLTGLLNFYSKCYCLSAAEQLFDEMSERDVIAHNAMIATLSSHGRVEEARKLFDQMPEKSSASWNSMITCYCKHNDLCAAREIFDQNPVKDVVSWNAMIDGYCKMGHMVKAREFFDRMGSAKNSVTWNTLIAGYLHHREFGTALAMFQIMQMENVRPSEVTMVSLLTVCAHLGALKMGRWIHAYIKNHRLRTDVILGNALIDMYFKCGSITEALEVFHRILVRNVFCWNSIIAGLGMSGHGEHAIEVFLEMVGREKIKPDGITFVGLLSGCSHSGLVSEGKKYFSQMHKVYGLEPKIEHYGCMVDLLGRAGYLEEALNLVETMPIPPNAIVWGSLLRACRIHKNAKLSERVTQHLLQLDPNDGANYVFLSNIYACSNRWDDVEKCRKIMIEKGVRKVPGCSSTEVNNMIHEFVVGDRSHPQFEQIYAFLVEIDREIRKLGYQPVIDSVLHDIEDEEKENAIMYHSERIAIAFGLMSTSAKEPIRVVKNLRVCSDCHEATKFIAKLFQREIIVRDRNRFHHFLNGACSCKDYW
ncbi:pentatricopeptide repeat-containing protein At4g21065-like [Typha angustifolia]|uniref:pentatricopeptide repeat-containing protein At4g21065-like n=1 Tax=Typha angustifolia TaxID=59011 RepID=UPI003C2C3749